ncbi:MAG: sensor domain-containing diguanylate cyclase [Aquabacterium sp.]|nr:sensor domain-containing diguanylate cyclase [Aquabacterium sp.]
MSDADLHVIGQLLDRFGLGFHLSDDTGQTLAANRNHAATAGSSREANGDGSHVAMLDNGRRITVTHRPSDAELRFRLLAEHSTDLIIAVDADLAIRYASPAAQPLLGCAPAALHGHTLAELLAPEQRQAFMARHFSRSGPRDGGTELFQVLGPRGGARWVEARVAPLPPGNGLGDFLVTLRDAEQRRRAEEALGQANAELSALASTDALTGLPNRRQFDGTLQKEWLRALRDGIPLGLLMIDIDRFKSLNDRFGHQTGDRFLARVGHVIRQNVRRAGDMAARYGGEEFAAVLPGTGSTGALEMAETIRRCVASADTTDIVLGGYPISVSIGVAASVPLSGSGASALVHNADAALYQAKRNGRNRVEILH